MEGPAIAIVRSSRPWARALHRYVADYGGAVVRARPLEERQAIDEEYDILLVDDISSFLTHRLVNELHRRNRRILGVFDSSEAVGGKEGAGQARLKSLGVDDIIDAGTAPEDFLRRVQAMAPKAEADDEFGDIIAGLGGLEGVDAASLRTRSEPLKLREGLGSITAVLGAAGGAGATEVALELGRVVRRRGEVGVVVDADELAPSMAQRLGLPLHPNIRAAVDAVQHGSGSISDCLMTTPGGQVNVLTGLSHPKDWVSLRPDEVTSVVEELARVCHHVVVNVAHCIEDVESMGGADRFGISRAVLSIANTVVVVGHPSPVGVARVLDRIADIVSFAPVTPIHVVMNQAPSTQFKRGEIIEELLRTYQPVSLHFVPNDKKVEEAGWQGELVRVGPFTSSITEVAKDIFGVREEGETVGRRSIKRKKKLPWMSGAR